MWLEDAGQLIVTAEYEPRGTSRTRGKGRCGDPEGYNTLVGWIERGYCVVECAVHR